MQVAQSGANVKKFLLCIPLFLFALSLFIPLDVNEINLSQAKLPPSLSHWFGTDLLGRDLFWRLIASFKVSFSVGVGAASLALLFALLFVFVFYFLPLVGEKILEIFLALPSLIFVMFLQSFFGGGIWMMVFIIALGHWALVAKVLWSEMDKIVKQDFYQCSRALGISKMKAIWSEILPSCANLVAILWVLNFIHAIGNEATLSFFGLGLEPTQPSLGNILADSSRAIFIDAWWMIVFPILALMLLILPLLFVVQDTQRDRILC